MARADSLDTTLEKPWWSHEEADHAAAKAYSDAKSLETDQSWRKARALLSIALYQSRGFQPGVVTSDPVAGGLGRDGLAMLADTEVNAGLLRSAVDTLVAEIAGRVKPTVKFLTKGADWKTKRRAEGLADWIDAVFRIPQGDYQNLWCLGPEIFKDCLIFGEGWIQIGSQCVDEKNTYDITFSRQFPWEMFVDPAEARSGRPRNLYRVTSMSVDDALLRFVDDASDDIDDEEASRRRQAIINAEEADDYSQPTRVVRMVKVVESWHLKRGTSTGRHIICVSGKCLFDEEWDREDFGFARLCWEKERLGFHARSMIEQGESLHLEFNENLQRLSERLNLMSNVKTFVTAGSCDLSRLEGNDEGQIIEVAPGAPLPQQQVPNPIAPSEVNYLGQIRELLYSTLGVSEMKASSRKEPGVDSGVAIRLMNDQQAGRFATAAEGYERLYVDCALGAIAEARMITAASGKVKVRSEKRGEIDFKEVQLPERQVDITTHPASALSTDPAQRIATAQELFGAGLISGPTFLRLIQLPDLESELNQQTVQERYADWAVCQLLDAEEETDYVAPDDLVPNKPAVMLYVANAYLEALLDGAPDLNKQLMRKFIADLDDMITRLEEEKAQQQAAMAPPPPPGAPPGPPGLPPGPPPPLQ